MTTPASRWGILAGAIAAWTTTTATAQTPKKTSSRFPGSILSPATGDSAGTSTVEPGDLVRNCREDSATRPPAAQREALAHQVTQEGVGRRQGPALFEVGDGAPERCGHELQQLLVGLQPPAVQREALALQITQEGLGRGQRAWLVQVGDGPPEGARHELLQLLAGDGRAVVLGHGSGHCEASERPVNGL